MIQGVESQYIQEVRQTVEKIGRKRENLLPILQAVQGKLGYLSREAMQEVARELEIPEMDVFSVVTFYSQFRLHPPGKHSIRVCLGTACHMKGGHIALDAWKRRLHIEPGETTPDGEFDLDTVACVGCCALAPVTVVDNRPEARVDPTRVDGLLLAFQRRKQPGSGKDNGRS